MRRLIKFPLDFIIFVFVAAGALLLSVVPIKADEIEGVSQMERLSSMRYFDVWMSEIRSKCPDNRPSCTFFVRVGGDDFVLNAIHSPAGLHIEQLDGVNNSGLEEPFGSSPDQVVLLDEQDPMFSSHIMKVR